MTDIKEKKSKGGRPSLLTEEQWETVRTRWENDPREGFSWIVQELSLPCTRNALNHRAKADGWAKRAPMREIIERAQTQADSTALGVKKVNNDDAVDLRAKVIEKHRYEWDEHRRLFPTEEMSCHPETETQPAYDGYITARAAKTAAEAIRLRQEGERKAWALDAISEPPSAGRNSMDELDAMYDLAVRRAEEMREKIRTERRHVIPATPDVPA